MKRVDKPWGYYIEHLRGKNCVMKTIVIFPGQRLSTQKHFYRNEFWFVQEGSGILYLENTSRKCSAGQTVSIFSETIHGFYNNSDKEVVIQEMQYGELCDENDIVRLVDIYGRQTEQGILDLEKVYSEKG